MMPDKILTMKSNSSLRPLLLPFLLTIAFTAVLTGQQRLSLDIDHISVYPSGATLERKGFTPIIAGQSEIIITGLPLNIDESTMSVGISKGVILLSQKYHREYVDVAQLKSKYEDQILTVTDSITWLDMRSEIISGQETLLDKNRQLCTNDQSISLTELKALSSFYNEEMLQLKADKLALIQQKRTLKNRLELLKKQLNQAQRQGNKGEGQLHLTVQSSRAMTAQIEIEYFVREASWTQEYDIRVADLDSDVELVYKASISQYTGEDWTDVVVSLSSAEPNRYYTVPELHPYYLNYQEYYARPQMMRKEADAVMLNEVVVATGMAEAEEEVGYSAVPAAMTESLSSFSYDINLPYTIVSGGQAQSVLLKSEEIKADYRYVTVPKLSASAFLTAQINDWEELSILPGQANIYLENRYVGKTFISDRPGESDYIISLGKDDDILIKRELAKGYEKSKFIGSNKQETRRWELSVINTKSKAIDIQIWDQYPISQNSDIKVDLKEDGDAKANNEERGILSWEEQIAPRGEWSTTIEYQVKYPKDRSIFIQ